MTVLESALKKVNSVEHFKQIFFVSDVKATDTSCNNFKFIFKETVNFIGYLIKYFEAIMILSQLRFNRVVKKLFVVSNSCANDPQTQTGLRQGDARKIDKNNGSFSFK